MKQMLFVFILIASTSAFAQVQTGDCTNAKKYSKISYNNSEYQCWYGTDQNDLMILFDNAVGIRKREENSGITDISGKKFNSKKKQVLFGLSGDDEVKVYEYSSLTGYLHGGKGHDEVHGGKMTDYLYGDEGNDYVYGKKGDDYIYGGSGADFMTGFEGKDMFYVDGTWDSTPDMEPTDIRANIDPSA